MKSSLKRLALAATLLCSMTVHADEAEDRKKTGPTGIVHVPYTFSQKVPGGFESITFTIRIDEAPERKRSFYYAMQFKFIDGNGGYIGIQPRGADRGMAVFSTFGNDTVPVAENCRGGADGGHGVSCSKMFDIAYKTEYYLTVARDKKDKGLWHGTIKNVKTGEKTEIGSWKPKAASKGLEATNGGFVEFFPLIEDCSDIPKTKGFFGNPSARKANGKIISGKVGKLTTYGKCKNMSYSTSQGPNGSTIELLPK